MAQAGFGRVLYNGPSLLRMMYSFYSDAVDPTAVPTFGIDSGIWDGVKNKHDVKIPPGFEQTIREVFMPTLLDHGGTFELTGSPSRQMAGLFYDVTRDDGKAVKGWSVHRWNLLANPHFGRAIERDGTWWALNKIGEYDGGPYATQGEAADRAAELRYRDGILDLQSLI